MAHTIPFVRPKVIPFPEPTISPLSVTTLGWEGRPTGVRFNNSVLPWGGKLLMAYREDTCVGKAGLYLTELDPGTFQPVGVPIRPYLGQRLSPRTNQEDPRLFEHGDRLHMVFCFFAFPKGTPGPSGPESEPHLSDGSDPRLFSHLDRIHLAFAAIGGTRIRQLFAVLRDDLSAERVWEVPYAGTRVVEKNYAAYSCGGSLLAIYSHSPWVIIDCLTGEEVSRQAGIPWEYGEPRGGAPPVLCNGEWYSWFHGTQLTNGLRRYTVGVCTFEAKPPFRPLRISPIPVLLPDEVDRDSPSGLSCVFPCGVFLQDSHWVLSAGYMDREARVYVFDREEVERQLVKM